MAPETPPAAPAPPTAPASFDGLAVTAAAVAATTKRLEKAALIGAYFKTLDDQDLPRAARFLAGTPFSLRDQRSLNVGTSLLLGALERLSGQDPARLRARLVQLGDLGDLAADVLPPAAPAPLTLAEVQDRLAALAAEGGSKRRAGLLDALLGGQSGEPARYLVRLLVGDLRVGLQEGALEDAIARWCQRGVEVVQRANMLTGDIGEVALLARADRLGEARLRLFHPLKFMLASPAADPGGDVAAALREQMPSSCYVEDKYDGIRAQVHLERPAPADAALHGQEVGGARVAIFSRTLDELTGSYPDLLPALARLLPEGRPGSLILDGELLPVELATGRVLPFQVLQTRLQRKRLDPELLAAVPVMLLVYDLLYQDGEERFETPLADRRARLDALPGLVAADQPGADLLRRSRLEVLAVSDPAALTTALNEPRSALLRAIDTAFDAARARGNEGLMVKDPRSPYRPGRRGREWLKVKRALATLDVVVTSVEVGHGKRRHLLSDFTFAVRGEDGALLNVGKAYSGLTDAELAELTAWFQAHTVQELAHGKVRIVDPTIVIEVAFDAVQPSPRHKAGFALRFPRILRVRDDKTAAEIDTIETVRRLAAPR